METTGKLLVVEEAVFQFYLQTTFGSHNEFRALGINKKQAGDKTGEETASTMTRRR